MESERAELIAWCEGEQKSAQEQLTLFGEKGAKAVLQMPDGTSMDITEAVLRHQEKNAAAYERLLAFLASSNP